MGKTPLTVLIIDDDVFVLKSVSLLLRSTGWNIKTVSDVKPDFKIEEGFLPDVIVCDVVMPDVSGPELVSKLKADAVTKEIPIVLMSGNAHAEMFAHLDIAGFLQKPFTGARAVEAIQNARKATSASATPPHAASRFFLQ